MFIPYEKNFDVKTESGDIIKYKRWVLFIILATEHKTTIVLDPHNYSNKKVFSYDLYRACKNIIKPAVEFFYPDDPCKFNPDTFDCEYMIDDMAL